MNKKPLLTKLQRYTAYCIMLAEFEENGAKCGLCHLSGSLFDLYPLHPLYKRGSPAIDENRVQYTEQEHATIIYPELWAKRSSNRAWWFDNDKERIAALKQCIKETHP